MSAVEWKEMTEQAQEQVTKNPHDKDPFTTKFKGTVTGGKDRREDDRKKLEKAVRESSALQKTVETLLSERLREFDQLINDCPLVKNLESMSMGERSKYLAEHSVALDEWYHKLKIFRRKLSDLLGGERNE
jgi:hypothetical protein